MLGGIYSGERCGICGGKLKDNRKDAVCCPEHPQIQARRIRVHFKQVKKRFMNYEKAQKFLYGLRFETDKGVFDPRNYAKGEPLGFANLVGQFLQAKRHIKAIQAYQTRLDKSISIWGNRNIREIGNLEISRFVGELQDRHASYYAHIIVSLLKTFWNWCFDMGFLRYGIDPMPKFPTVKYEMAFRKTIDRETQEKVLEQIRKDTKDNPRIYIAINMLRTYLHVRPMELVKCNEEHLQTKQGILIVPTSKEGRSKIIELYQADIKDLLALPRGFPKMPLFRYDKGIGGQRPDSRFGHHVLNNVWNRACDSIGIHGVSLYRPIEIDDSGANLSLERMLWKARCTISSQQTSELPCHQKPKPETWW